MDASHCASVAVPMGLALIQALVRSIAITRLPLPVGAEGIS